MTTIQNCFDLNEAHRFQIALDAAGIPSFIPDEFSAGMAPYQFFGSTGVRLQVADEHAAEARQILEEERRSSTETEASSTEETEPKQPL